jgi:hypothetical protein
MVNILGFVGHSSSLTQLCQGSTRVATRQQVNGEHCRVPIKFYLQRQMLGQVEPLAVVCQSVL